MKKEKILVIFISFALHGCSSMLPKANEIASVNISVNNVTPWRKISSLMQPNFSLTGDGALAKVLPITERVQQQTLNAFYAGLGVAASLDGKSTLTAPTPSSAIPANAQMPTAPNIMGATPDVGLLPSMQYEAANSLFEKVQMLNRDVTDAAIQNGYQPYLVRLKLAVMPYQHYDLAYDIHTRISFFPDVCPTPTPTPTPGSSCLDFKKLDNMITKSPVVIPLLAVDDIERQLKANASEVAKQISMAISAALPNGISGILDGNALSKQDNTVLGEAYNNRLAITRENDSTLSIRIGATYSGGNNDSKTTVSLVNQSYDIAVLFLVPDDFLKENNNSLLNLGFNAFSYTELRNTENGYIVDNNNKREWYGALGNNIRDLFRLRYIGSTQQLDRYEHAKKIIQNIFPDYCLKNCDDINKIDQLIESTNQRSSYNYFQIFSDEEKNSTAKIIKINSLFPALASLNSDSNTKQAYFEVPSPELLRLPSITNSLFLVDNQDKNEAVINISGVYGGDITHLHANLKENNTLLYEKSIVLDQNTHILTITFPSLLNLGVKKDSNTEITLFDRFHQECDISHVYCNLNENNKNIQKFPIKINAKVSENASAGKKADFSFTQSVKQIVADKGNGTATVKITVPPKSNIDSVKISVSNAEIVSVSDGTQNLTIDAKNMITVTKTTNLTYTLRNLGSARTVNFSANGFKGDESISSIPLEFIAI